MDCQSCEYDLALFLSALIANAHLLCVEKYHQYDIHNYKWLGPVHDAKGFAKFTVCEKLQSGKINQTSLNLLPGYDTLPNYIIVDPTHLLTSDCMKEYQTWVENNQVVTNNLVRNARN